MSNQGDIMKRLDDQIEWYDSRSLGAQTRYKALKFTTLIAGALVPLSAGLGWQAVIVGGIGVLIVVTEGIQQINQYHHNWVTYRSTCEALKHEKYIFNAQAGPYSDSNEPLKLLAERVESLVSQEHAKWISAQERAVKEAKGK